jgi:hypothetical protein
MGLVGAVVVAAAASACGVADRQVLEVTALSADERSVELMVASCNGSPAPTAQVDENEGSVVVRVTGGTTNEDCADSVCIELDRPLDGRALIDATTDTPLSLVAVSPDPFFVRCP